MILLPAIDLYEGKVVRLTRGDYSRMTVYREDPLDQAREFEAAGAAWLHTVDLEGARDGATPNFRVVAELCRSTGLQVEVGGGIRDMDTVEYYLDTLEAVARYLDAGAARVILGTAAVTDPVFLRTALDRFGDRVAVGVDLKDGAIAIQGWRETAPEPAEAFFQRLVDWGVRTVICTDVSRDGMLGGTNVALYQSLAERLPLQLIASGGVSSLEELRRLKALGLYGAILGKALYTGALSLRDALGEVE